jgi:hypothetical protein
MPLFDPAAPSHDASVSSGVGATMARSAMRRNTLILFVTILATSAGGAAAHATAPATRPTTRPATLADRIWSDVTIGGSGADDTKRRVNNFDLERGGWRRFIDRTIRPQIAWGCRNFVIACPGGFTGAFEMGQMVHARDGVPGVHGKLPWLVKDFDTAFAALRDEYEKKGIHLRIMPYVGAGAADAELVPGKTTPDERARYRDDALRPLLRAGNALGLDAMTLIAEGSEQQRFIAALAASGVPIYGEGYPNKKTAWTADYNVYCTQDNFNRRTDGNADFTPTQGGWGVAPSRIKGELVILYDEHTYEGLIPFARRHLAAGRSVSLPLYELVAKRVPMAALAPAPE